CLFSAGTNDPMVQLKIPLDRLKQLWVLTCIGAFLLGFRLIDLQILRHKHFSRVAEMNRTLVIYKNAPRGKIITKDNTIIVANQPSFSLVYLPAGEKNINYLKKLSKDFSARLNVSPEIIEEKLQKAFDAGAPIRLAEDLPLKSVFSLSELKTVYASIDLVSETKRYYPYGKLASHLIGYMGKMDGEDWTRLRYDGRYRLDANIGKSGLEKMFETDIKGTDGGLYLEVDSKGKLKRVLQNQQWNQGSNLHLTIDFKTQKAAEEGLENSLSKVGAVVAINPKNGEILALASSPNFDPNMFVSYNEDFERLVRDLPEYNYAIKGLYEPASTFKIIVAASALETGAITPDQIFYCPGHYTIRSRTFKCWEKQGHGNVNLKEAITRSCDVYFYQLGLKVGPATIEKFSRGFRLGMLSGIPMPGEKRGNVFGPTERAKKLSYWFAGDTLNLSIGQGETLVTPIQMAQVMAAVANKGKFWRPHFIEKIESQEGKILFKKKVELLSMVNLKPQTWDVLQDSLLSVVNEGTGRLARIKGVEVYGKTGTAQNPRGPEHGWFVAFAKIPGKESEIAVCVFLQHGEHGYLAAPIARDVIKAALRLS
ncbi:MAG TPA: penicillin-binding protein 2, partial [Elusimicrobiales bacterium]|nr:penicillin-binding protein 2 [Elusimicrobiales bacterium]